MQQMGTHEEDTPETQFLSGENALAAVIARTLRIPGGTDKMQRVNIAKALGLQ